MCSTPDVQPPPTAVDPAVPWHSVRVNLGSDLGADVAFTDAIRGVDKADAMRNAWSTWTDALHIDYLGASDEDSDQHDDTATPSPAAHSAKNTRRAGTFIHHDTTRGENPIVKPPEAPRVVCLCGSMRFQDAMHHVAVHESLCGDIVLMPHVNMRRGDVEAWYDATEPDLDYVKEELDRLHKKKIDLADSVIVVTDAAGYVGESTRSEIAYAESLGKPVWYWRWEITADGGDRR